MVRALIIGSGVLLTAAMVSADGAEDKGSNTESATVVAVKKAIGSQLPRSEPKAKITREQAERVTEIVELREQMGGSLLSGTALDDNSSEGGAIGGENYFFRAVQRQLATPSTERCEEAYRSTLESGELDDESPGTFQPTYSARLPGHSADYAEPDLAAALRLAGRELDNWANDLEDIGDYRRGDELRRLARRIRRVAREAAENDSASRRAAELPLDAGFSR